MSQSALGHARQQITCFSLLCILQPRELICVHTSAPKNRILLLILQEERSTQGKCFELLLFFPVIYWHSYSRECIETGGNWGSYHSSHHLCSNESRHKNAGHKKSDQVMLSTSMPKQIQKSEKSNTKVKIMY
jgi:hypothetical protein